MQTLSNTVWQAQAELTRRFSTFSQDAMHAIRDSKYAWAHYPDSQVSLDAAGLVALADLSTVAKRTALTGNAVWLDMFIICPGLHRQQSATELNLGEYPAAGALTTGYVFRIENPATVLFLQKISQTGTLTHVEVSNWDNKSKLWRRLVSSIFVFQTASTISATAYLLAATTTAVALVLFGLAHEVWGVGVLCMLILARLINTWVVRKRCVPGWHGEKEPGVKSDLLILLSQDRWIRMKGPVDDVKAVTSGQWLREQSFLESSLSAAATVLVYLNAALASNVNNAGKILLVVQLLVSVGLLAIANEFTDALYMHGCKVRVTGEHQTYARRLDLAKALLKEADRKDWEMRAALSQMGVTVPKDAGFATKNGQIIM
jgi:hypothetical protein